MSCPNFTAWLPSYLALLSTVLMSKTGLWVCFYAGPIVFFSVGRRRLFESVLSWVSSGRLSGSRLRVRLRSTTNFHEDG